MKKLIVANYKMNGNINFYKGINKLVNKLHLKDTKIILCPPFVYMPFLKLKNDDISLGSQDISSNENNKSTGQIAGYMLKEFDVEYALIGHGERREIGETDELIANKVKIAQAHDITPIVCIGEKSKTCKLEVLIKQVRAALSKAEKKEIIFAYEPIWAIGSNTQPSIERIKSAIKIIKDTSKNCGFKVKVLYGGGVDISNVKEILKSNAEGLLLGGISLKTDDFLSICKEIR